MYRLTDIRDIKRLAAKYGFTFKKGFGQNFLTDESVLDQMIHAAKITKGSTVLEIGPGFGVLTQKLCENAGLVLSFEIDRSLLPVLKQTLSPYDNYEIIQQDIMKTDLGETLGKYEIDGKITVAANLPYYISTPILMRLLEQRQLIDMIVVMLQKEVAQRVVASCGSKDYGALSVAVQYACEAEIVTIVEKQHFIPMPKVDSAVVCLRVLDQPRIQGVSQERYFRLVKAAFAQRRKTLKNALSNAGGYRMTKEEIGELIVEVCGDENVRGEALSLEMFGEIAKKIF